MTVNMVKRAAELRGIHFNGERRWLNNMVGYGYEIFVPQSREVFFQADTLEGIYKYIMRFKKEEILL